MTVRHGDASALPDVRRRLEARPDRLACGPSAVLHAIVDRKRNTKSQVAEQLDTALPNTSEYSESQMTSGWEQNSFVTPLDSRAAKL